MSTPSAYTCSNCLMSLESTASANSCNNPSFPMLGLYVLALQIFLGDVVPSEVTACNNTQDHCGHRTTTLVLTWWTQE